MAINQLVVAIKDRAVNAVLGIGLAPTKGAAIRNFQDDLAQPNNQMAKHPDDYELWILGEMNTETGQIKPEAVLLAVAKDHIKGA